VPNCTTASCPLPPSLRHFTDANVSDAFDRSESVASVGGWSSAMDYVPVRVGYWNCQDTGPTTTSLTRDGEGGDIDNATTLVSSAMDSKLFGGQSHCPSCRCLVSSLMDVTKLNINPSFPRYGLCYRTNCFRSDYLQVAIRSQFTNRIDWYRCPVEGGKLHIPGYTGALHCPPATSFCRLQDVSGVRYPETQLWLEWTFWGLVAGLPLVLAASCTADRARRGMSRGLKRCCGVTTFLPLDGDGKRGVAHGFLVATSTVWGIAVVNATVFVVSAAALIAVLMQARSVALRTITVPAAALLVYIMTVALMGVLTPFKRVRGVSCAVVAQYFLSCASVMLLLWGAVWALAFQGTFQRYVANNWSSIAELMSCCYDAAASRAEQQMQATDTLKRYAPAVAATLTVAAAILAIGVALTARLMSRKVTFSTTFAVLNHTSLLVGFGVAALVAYVRWGTPPELSWVLPVMASTFVVMVAVFGFVALRLRRGGLMYLHSFLNVIVVALAVYGAYSAGARSVSTTTVLNSFKAEEIAVSTAVATVCTACHRTWVSVVACDVVKLLRCDAMRCDAMRCDAMRCDAMRCDAMRCDAMRCDAMRCDMM
jgi:pentapeptide MXKDX repeat protein